MSMVININNTSNINVSNTMCNTMSNNVIIIYNS